jgi:hypothetical protein
MCPVLTYPHLPRPHITYTLSLPLLATAAPYRERKAVFLLRASLCFFQNSFRNGGRDAVFLLFALKGLFIG